MIASLFLVIITIVKGSSIDENPFFLTFELLINFFIIVDFIFRIKLIGTKRFFEGGIWNIIDIIVVAACIVLFVLMLLP
jgi:hypothetical protein